MAAPVAAAALLELLPRNAANIADAAKLTKVNDYITDINTTITGINEFINAPDEAAANRAYKTLPLIVRYSPRVGGKSRRRNNKNNKSRRRNQSKRQRK